MRPAIASAASAATRATTCDGGRERSYQAKPPSRTSAEDQEAGQLPAHRPPASLRAPSAPCSGVITPGQVEHPGDLGGEVPAAGEDLGRPGRRRSRTPSPSRTTRSAKAAANSTSWVATTTRGAARRRARSIRSTRSSLRARSMPRVGSSSGDQPGSSSPPSAPPARSPAPAAGARRRRGRAGRRRRACSRPTARERLAPASPGSSSPTRSRTR